MTKIYACLAGNWVCLNDDENCAMGPNRTSPYLWYEEGAPIYSHESESTIESYYNLDYINIYYKGKDYRINPIFIQVVKE